MPKRDPQTGEQLSRRGGRAADVLAAKLGKAGRLFFGAAHVGPGAESCRLEASQGGVGGLAAGGDEDAGCA